MVYIEYPPSDGPAMVFINKTWTCQHHLLVTWPTPQKPAPTCHLEGGISNICLHLTRLVVLLAGILVTSYIHIPCLHHLMPGDSVLLCGLPHQG